MLNYKIAVPTKCLPLRSLDRKCAIERCEMRRCIRYKEREEFKVKNSELLVEDITLHELAQESDDKIQNTQGSVPVQKQHVQIQTILSLRSSQLISCATLNDVQLHHFTGFSRQLFTFFVCVLVPTM